MHALIANKYNLSNIMCNEFDHPNVQRGSFNASVIHAGLTFYPKMVQPNVIMNIFETLTSTTEDRSSYESFMFHRKSMIASV